MSVEPYIANTDRAWFDYLRARAFDGHLDEVNFWLPKAVTPMKRMAPGDLIFFRLKEPDHVIVGYGFYAHFACVDLDTVWSTFTWKNGDPDRWSFLKRISS